MELAQHRTLLFVVRLHAAQDVVENADGRDDIGALVEHDALGALAHRGVGDLRARRDSGFRKRFETCVAQMTGMCAASQIQRISSWTSARRW